MNTVTIMGEPCGRLIPMRGSELDKLLATMLRFPARLKPKADSWPITDEIIQYLQDRGFYLTLKGPFQPGESWWAGFTQHGASGWNGVPDYYASAPTWQIAIARAAVLCWQETDLQKFELDA